MGTLSFVKIRGSLGCPVASGEFSEGGLRATWTVDIVAVPDDGLWVLWGVWVLLKTVYDPFGSSKGPWNTF